MKVNRRVLATALLAGVATSLLAQASEAAVESRVRNVVLVHGAYADGSSWSEVIPLLQHAGMHVTAKPSMVHFGSDHPGPGCTVLHHAR
jgi:hypothetical protein